MSQDELIFDRTQEDVDSRTEKGFYMSGDLNRVGNAVQDIAEFAGLPIQPRTNWVPGEFRMDAKMEQYLSDLQNLRRQFTVFRDTPGLPKSINLLDYQNANNIEKMLYDMGQIKEIILASWWRCGELFCGEVLL